MVDYFDEKKALPLGTGQYFASHSLKDADLRGQLMRYRRSVASAYSSVSPNELGTAFPGSGPFHVSPKIDGELWFLVIDGDDVFLSSPRGAGIKGDISVLEEARSISSSVSGRAVIAGELYAAEKSGDDRPRISDLAAALGGGKKAQVDRLGFMAFDIVQISEEAVEGNELQSAEGKSAVLERLFGVGKRLKTVPYKVVPSTTDVKGLFNEWVENGKAEGLVVRIQSGRIFKIKSDFTVDAAVVAYTERRGAPDEVGSIALALMHENGFHQFIGSCGTIGSEETRRELHARLSNLEVDANFRKASSGGGIYKFVRPEIVVEIKAHDAQSRDAADKPIRQMFIEYGDGGWTGRRLMPGASLLHAVLSRVRDDKDVSQEEIRYEQIQERCFIEDTTEGSETNDLPKSEVFHREVYVKETKGNTAVRKLLIWKTNKEDNAEDFPAYVVHWTDYSPGRKDPIKRTVRPAGSKKSALSIGDKMIEDNIKKGWSSI